MYSLFTEYESLKAVSLKVIIDARHLADGLVQCQAGDITAACIPLIAKVTGLTAEGLYAMSLSHSSALDGNIALSIYQSGLRIDNFTSVGANDFRRIIAARNIIFSDSQFSLRNDVVNFYRSPRQFRTVLNLINNSPPEYVLQCLSFSFY